MSSLVSRPFLHMGESLEMKLTDVFSSVSPWHQFNPPPDLSSWSVRHCAILGLSRVCRTCRKLPMKDGMSNVSWSKLMQRHSIEKDNRVLEAYKLSQVCCTSVRIYTYVLTLPKSYANSYLLYPRFVRRPCATFGTMYKICMESLIMVYAPQ